MPIENMGMNDKVSKGIGKGFSNSIGLNGKLTITHLRNGQILEVINTPNTIMNAGLASASGLLNGVVSNYYDYLAIGIGTAAPAATQTTLTSEITDDGGARATSTNTQITTGVANDTAQFVKQWTFSGTFAVTESGIFDTSSAGNMLARQTFSAINVISGDSLQITWKVQCS